MVFFNLDFEGGGGGCGLAAFSPLGVPLRLYSSNTSTAIKFTFMKFYIRGYSGNL